MIKPAIALTTFLLLAGQLHGGNVSDSLQFEKYRQSFYRHFNKGNYRKAHQTLQRALCISQKAKEPEKKYPNHLRLHAQLPPLLSNLGQFQKALDESREAEHLILEKVGKHHSSYPILLNNRAYIYLDLGCYEQAKETYKQAISISEDVQGKRHSLYPVMLNNLGNIHEEQGQYKRAFELYERAVKIDSLLSHYKPQRPLHIYDLARILHLRDDKKNALRLYRKAVRIFKDTVGTSHSYYVRTMNGFGDFHLKNGNPEKALSQYQKAKGIADSTIGKNHQLYIEALTNIAGYYTLTGNARKALEFYKESRQRTRYSIDQMFSFLAEPEKENYLSTVQQRFEQFYAFTAQVHDSLPSTACLAYQNEMMLKELVLSRSRGMRKAIRNEAGAAVMEQYEKWRTIKERLARQYARPRHQRTTSLDSLAQEALLLERKLVQQSAHFRKERKQTVIDCQAVRDSLSKGEAALEIIKYRPWAAAFSDTTVYAALLLTKDVKCPRFIRLFNERELRQLLKRQQHGSDEGHFIKHLYNRYGKGNALYELVWSQLEPYLEDIETIYYSPAGLLHRLNLKAIPHPAAPRLADRYKFVRLGSTRKLTEKPPQPQIDSVALIGGIRYAYMPDSQTIVDGNERFIREDKHAGHQTRTSQDTFRYLAGSAREVEALSIQLAGEANVERLTGVEATESAFKELSGRSPNVIHISTHGFFFQREGDTSATANADGKEAVLRHAGNPLLRSGLALAGSNYAWQHGYNPYKEEDGILTAYEIANMNLSGTDIVVLSACETGLGKIHDTEGVYGLQRAFKMAGVDYLLISLWQVPDEETRQLMTLFYENWVDGLPVRKALNHAQQTMAQDYAPYYWASFVLVGGGKVDSAITETDRTAGYWTWLVAGVGVAVLMGSLLLIGRVRWWG